MTRSSSDSVMPAPRTPSIARSIVARSLYTGMRTVNSTGLLLSPGSAGRFPRRRDAVAGVVPERDDGCPGHEDVIPREPDTEGRGQQDAELQAEEDGVHGALGDQHDVRREEHEVQD